MGNLGSVPGETSCPLGRKNVARPVCEVTSTTRGERWANVVISLPGVPQEFPLMVGYAACAGRWVLLGVLFFLASDALGWLSTRSIFLALKVVNKQTINPELKRH